MQLILLSASIALALAGVRAQLPPQVTPCIETCLAQAAAEDLDGCSVTDVQCLCANKKIQQDVFSCLQQQCSTQEFEEVQVFVAAECAPPASSTSSSTSARATSPITTTHSEAPSTIHATSSSEEHTSERTSAVLTTIAPSTRLTSVTTTVNATSLANSNSTSLLSTTSTAPVALSTASSNSSSSSSSEASITVSSASPARTNAAPRVGPAAVGMLVLGAVLGGAAVW